MTNQRPLSFNTPVSARHLAQPPQASGLRQLGFYRSSGYWLLAHPDIDVVVEEEDGVFYVWLGETTWPVHSWGGLLRRIRQLTGLWLPVVGP